MAKSDIIDAEAYLNIRRENDHSDCFPNYCPLCGEDLHDGDCDPLLINNQQKPIFSIGDLQKYKEEFLIEIIRWYDARLKIVEGD